MPAKPKQVLLVALMVVLLLGVTAALVFGPRDDPKSRIAEAFTRYQAAAAAWDAPGVIAVSSPDSITYFGSYLRDHALSRTREEMAPRSVWEQVVILVYRDRLGSAFLLRSTPEEVYAELIHQHLFVFEVKGLTLGPVSINGKSAEGLLLRHGSPTGASILFDGSPGRWTVITHSNVGYALEALRDQATRADLDKTEAVRQIFARLSGKQPDDALWDPPHLPGSS